MALCCPLISGSCSLCNTHTFALEKNKWWTKVYSLLRADMSMFPSLMRSFINLLVRSSSISWHCSRSLNSGLSRKESLNSSVGRPIDKWRQHTDTEWTNTAKRVFCALRGVFTGENSVSPRSGKIGQKLFPAPFFHAVLTFPPHNFRTPKQQQRLWQTQFGSGARRAPRCCSRFKYERLQNNAAGTCCEQISRLKKCRPWLKESSRSSVLVPAKTVVLTPAAYGSD